LYARQSRLRLDAEIIRDTALAAGGLLNATLGGTERLSATARRRLRFHAGQEALEHGDRPRSLPPRHVYVPVAFEPVPGDDGIRFPDANVACTRRSRSNTPCNR